jgi:hypothetical protein
VHGDAADHREQYQQREREHRYLGAYGHEAPGLGVGHFLQAIDYWHSGVSQG